ncbi:TdeIII family type II restriction endonuclease [Vibrio cholerae]|nr:TdeIII family type II restriction endonuclease [Vibrio cholerae]
MTPIQIEAIAHEFQNCVDRTITRISTDDGYRPFHAALLSEDAIFWSRFERSFSTSFGQRVIEQISRICALSGGADQAITQAETVFDIDDNHLSYIENHISQVRFGGARGHWETDLHNLYSTRMSGISTRIRVISDLYWQVNGVNHYMSIKTVKPNIDQTAEAKRDLLKLKAFDPNCRVYFGLYYNPFSEHRGDYSWTPPQRIFDFREDCCVLIGREYWDTLGGPGTYEEVLQIARNVGQQTRQQIFGIR